DCQARAFATEELPHPDRVESLVFSPRGDRLATGCKDGQARVFPVGPGSSRPCFPPLPHREWSSAVHGVKAVPPLFVEGGDRLVTQTGTELIWWDAETGARGPTTTLRRSGRVTVLAQSADGKILAVGDGGSSEGVVQLYEEGSGQPVGPPLRHRNV